MVFPGTVYNRDVWHARIQQKMSSGRTPPPPPDHCMFEMPTIVCLQCSETLSCLFLTSSLFCVIIIHVTDIARVYTVVRLAFGKKQLARVIYPKIFNFEVGR